MRRLIMATCVLLTLAQQASADEPAHQEPGQEAASYGTNPAPPTVDMWFYQQEVRRHDDPKQAVRRNAEFRSAQRRQRLASSKWYGHSGLRPTVNPTPWFGTYGPHWTSTSLDPNRWFAVGAPPVVVIEPSH